MLSVSNLSTPWGGEALGGSTSQAPWASGWGMGGAPWPYLMSGLWLNPRGRRTIYGRTRTSDIPSDLLTLGSHLVSEAFQNQALIFSWGSISGGGVWCIPELGSLGAGCLESLGYVLSPKLLQLAEEKSLARCNPTKPEGTSTNNPAWISNVSDECHFEMVTPWRSNRLSLAWSGQSGFLFLKAQKLTHTQTSHTQSSNIILYPFL